MGIVRMGVPEELSLLLRDKYGIRNFVETGTYQGGTAEWATRHFENVFTIEGQKDIYEATSARLSSIPNLTCLLGDSRDVFKGTCARLNGPTLFWLDSHWCGQETFGFESQCPLLFEIETIRNSGKEYFILVDDARLFMAPPPVPNKIEEWPTVDQVCSHLKQLGNSPYVVIFEDVFIAVPGFAQATVANFCQEHISEWWQNFKPRPKGIRGGIRQIVDGIGTLSAGVAAMLR